jgi:hypothetical protein
MCEVERGTDGGNTLPEYMETSGIRKEFVDQGTMKYPQTFIKQSYI